MANLIIPIPAKADLAKGIRKTYLDMLFATQDDQAHRVDVQLMRGKEQVNLSGAGISAYFIRYSDNATISLTGSVSGNIASVTLKKACYNKPGQFALIVKAAIDGVISTVFYGEGSIFVSSTDTILDEENVVPSLDDLLAQIAAMEAATKAANTATTNANTATSKANTATTNANNATTNANNAAAKINGMTVSATKGTDADVTVSEKDGVKHFAFTLPKGDKGDRGEKGETGSVENMPFYEGTPAAPGTASTGSSDRVSRGDHVHPFPKRIKHASSNAYAELRSLSGDRTKSVGVIDPDMNEEVDLYIARDTGKPSIRYKGAGASAVFHSLYSSLNKPTAGDVGAIPTTGGTVDGKIKAQYYSVGNANDYPCIEFEADDETKGKVGAIQFTATDTGRRFSLVHYPANQDGKTNKAFESFQFPQPDQNLAESKYYNVLTTKNPVSIAQGGTGKTTASEALAALGGVPTGRKINGKTLANDVTLVPSDIGGFVGCHEVNVTSESIAAGQTGTASVTFTAISGATKYYAVLCTNGTVWGYVSGVTISGTTLTVTFYNSSTGAHTIGTKILIIGVK